MQKNEEKRIVSQLSKEFSILSQAWKMVELEYGTIDKWGLNATDTGTKDNDNNPIYDKSAASIISERLRKHLNVAKVCQDGEMCQTRSLYTLSGHKLSDATPAGGSSATPADASFFLNDGTFVSIGWYDSSKEKNDFNVSLPGFNKDILGKTRFTFNISKDGVLPEGSLKTIDSWRNNCNLTNNSVHGGRGCTAWVIYNKNLDYLHCRNDLSWDGKTKCD